MGYTGNTVSSANASGSVWTPTTGSIVVLPGNPARTAAVFFNDSAAPVYLKLSGSASTGSYTVKLADQGIYTLPQPIFWGPIYAVWNTVVTTGSLFATELS